jgi:cold shock protein
LWLRYLHNINQAKEQDMATGKVKWFNNAKGYGFVQPDAGGQDVFIHISAVEKAGLKTLAENQKVSYELTTERGKTSAANLQLID